MYRSLMQQCSNAHLFVFAFDDECYTYLKAEGHSFLTVISLAEFEDNELLQIKTTRSASEYCWTCTPSTILYCIEKYNLDNCTYIDADMVFYDDPSILWEEATTNSVIITKHNYTPVYDQSVESGIYCVQFVGFRNNDKGMKVLRWWREACIAWCYARAEDGKFGDQKYLDDWTSRFDGVHVAENQGAGIAPWNCQQYSFEQKNNKITVVNSSTKVKFNVIFFHFHGMVFYGNDIVMLTGGLYKMSNNIIELFFKPYVKQLQIIKKEIIEKSFPKDPQGSKPALKEKPGLIFNSKMLVKSVINRILNASSLKFKKAQLYSHYYLIDSFTGEN